jgi:uncharacterized protein YkwD
MTGRRLGATVCDEVSTRKTRDNALALMVLLAMALAFIKFNPLGVARPLEDVEVVGCDGQTMKLDGRKVDLLRLHNEARAEHSVGQLCVQENLMAAAQGHAEDMTRRDFYAHETPEGLTPGDRITRAGYRYATYGENNNRLSGSYGGEPDRGELREAFESWMESPGHRNNILNPAFREVGFGLATGQYSEELGTTTMYVVDFGTRQ